MTLIIRSMIAALFLITLATPSLAQNPDVAVRIRPLRGNCFSIEVKNLRSAVVGINFADISVYDQICRRTCISRLYLGKRLAPCRTLDFRLCCGGGQQLPAKYIAYVRVFHSNGRNEAWFHRN